MTSNEDRLRMAEARLKTLKQLSPNSPEVSRFEKIVEDLKTR